jgi:hypothetical protein
MISSKWVRIALINLLIVALLGVIMRYKIAYSLPFIEQKKIQHAHSHFAFSGWITQVLMTLMVIYLGRQQVSFSLKKYKWLLSANLIASYGMLLTFPFQGYGLYSISFSTLTIFVSYFFAYIYWRDLDRLATKDLSHSWFKAALLFNVISSIGAFTLAGMMATKTVHQNWYLHAEYFFLHFQYNGWFFFCCMGLLYERLYSFAVPVRNLKLVFWLFAVACIPAYILSVLWVKIPPALYVIVILSAIAQVAGWAMLLKTLRSTPAFISALSPGVKWLFMLSAIALSIKLLLQLGSTIPVLSQLAFGFHPIVIGYLHLVFLGVITLFILGYLILEKHLSLSRITYTGIFIFTAGVILNEIVLMVQGISYLNYNNIPYINEALLAVAIGLFSGIALMITSPTNVSTETDLNHR